MSGVDARLEAIFRAGAVRASEALAAWLDRPASLVVERLESLPLVDGMAVLGLGDEPISAAAMQVMGGLDGVLLLTAADEAGLVLADLLLGRPAGTSREWGDLELSALAETANIVGCSYLAALAAAADGADAPAALPSPPCVVRDFPAAVMEAVLAAETTADIVMLATTEFRIEGVPIRCGVVFVPDAAAAARLMAADGRG